jgi:hypothetical protein
MARLAAIAAPGTNGICAHAGWREVQRHGADHADDRRLRAGIADPFALADKAVHRGDRDQGAGALRDKMWGCVAAGEEDRHHIVIDNPAELGRIGGRDVGATADAGGDDDAVKAAQTGDAIADERLDSRRVRGITSDGPGRAKRLQPPARGAQDLGPTPVKHDRRTVSEHRLGAGKADAGAAADHQRALALQPGGHGLTS